jgi:hypothetical protein
MVGCLLWYEVGDMVYYADSELSGSFVRVGWLDKMIPLNTGTADDVFLLKLRKRYHARTNQTRGYHLCPFCANPEFGVPMELEGKQFKLGSAEIHVKDPSGRIFVAPDLIYHYIVVHKYVPPREFIDAVCSLP